MKSETFEQEKRRVYAKWTRRGPKWDRRADEIAGAADRVNQPLLEAAGLEPGQVVLDLASGAGEPAITIARLVGPEGHVTATDLVPRMLAGARRRAAAAGLANMAFEIVDMEAMPFENDAFDRLTCRFGLMFCPRPTVALAEALRVLRPGGRAAIMVWGPRHDNTMFRVFAAASERVFGDHPDIDFATQFRLGGAGDLTALLSQSGFVEAEEREVRFSPKVPADRVFWTAQLEMSLGVRLDSAKPAERSALDEEIAAGFRACIHEGKYHIEMHARVGLGSKPVA